MGKDVYMLKLCKECRDGLIGFITVPSSTITEEDKCELCKKTKPVIYYRVTTNKGVVDIG